MAVSEWKRCEPWIEAALEYAGGSHTIEDVERGILAGRFALVPLERSALVLERVDYPQYRALHVFLAGGELSEIKAYFDHQLPEIARANGCKKMTISGRRGWVRALKDIGFSEAYTTITRDVR